MRVDTDKVRDFFDSLADTWDMVSVCDDARLSHILDLADIRPGVRVLDVACGTGVMIPRYLARGAGEVVGIDLSPRMIARAREKCADPRVRLLAGDAETTEERGFDRIVIYNAFPHFPDPGRLIGALADRLDPGGRLTIAHGAGRRVINRGHEQSASEVSLGLPPAAEVALLMNGRFSVDTIADEETLFLVSGILK